MKDVPHVPIIGGATGGATGLAFNKECHTFGEYMDSIVIGGFLGGFTGLLSGKFIALTGITGFAAEIGAAITVAPVSIGLIIGASELMQQAYSSSNRGNYGY